MNDTPLVVFNRDEAMAIGTLAAMFLEEAVENGFYVRGTPEPARANTKEYHLYSLEQALETIEAALEQKL